MAVPGHCRDTAVLKKALDSVLAPEHVRDRARYRGVPSEPAALAVRPDVKIDQQRRVHRPATAILRRCRCAGLAVDVAAAPRLNGSDDAGVFAEAASEAMREKGRRRFAENGKRCGHRAVSVVRMVESQGGVPSLGPPALAVGKERRAVA